MRVKDPIAQLWGLLAPFRSDKASSWLALEVKIQKADIHLKSQY